MTTKYQYQTDVEHVLSNAGMYLGSVEQLNQEIWLFDEIMTYSEVNFHPALYKIIDEPLTNCYDHYVRSKNTKWPMSCVRVEMDEKRVTIQNDGAPLDIEMHPGMNMYVPEMVFGHLRTSTNYGAEDKIVGGKHGLGVKLTAVWSSVFCIEVIDSTRGLSYVQEFKNNLQIAEPIIKRRRSKTNSVKLSFVPDFVRFGLAQFPSYMLALVRRRLYDFALLAPDVKFYFNGVFLAKRTFKNYISGCLKTSKFVCLETAHWKIAAGHSENGFSQLSFVNGIHTIFGGKHVEHVCSSLLTEVRELIKKRKQTNLPLKSLKDQLFLFVACDIVNPSFSGQIKESLIGGSFAAQLHISDEFIEKTFKYIANASCAIQTAKEKVKKEKQHAKTLSESDGRKTESIKGIPELTDANWAGTRRAKECILIVCEGESAATGVISGLRSEDRDRYGVYPLRGKLFNPQGKGADKIAANKVISDLKKVLGLESGRKYTCTSCLRYGKIVFMTDQDLDGHHIKALGLNVFYSLWPTLLAAEQFIGFIPTPIVKVTKGTKQESFFHEGEYRKWERDTKDAASWTVKYYKGLGTSTASDFRHYFKNVKIVHFEMGVKDESQKAFDMAFSKKCTDQRKIWLGQYDKNSAMTISPQNRVTFENFINNELIHFSKYDCDRSIPSIDGLKISQRKILFAALKGGMKEIKVAQFCGKVAEITHYHHGEGNLEKTIVGMAQDFVGSNNVNLLLPLGQFGSRRHGGEDAASGRYIFTRLNSITRLIFRPEDDPILTYAKVDGDSVEPVHYMPIVPLILVNGAVGIGTGFSCTILSHDLKQLINKVKNELQEEPRLCILPHFRGFRGNVQKEASGHYSTTGLYSMDQGKITITELPVGAWTVPYKTHLETLIDEGVIKSFNDLCTDRDILFEIFLADEIRKDDVVKIFKLKRFHYVSNMYMFDFEEKLKRFETVDDIIDYYIPVREFYYRKRKDHMLREIDGRLLVARNKERYIHDIIGRTLDVFQRKENLNTEMDKLQYDKIDNSYSYLFQMSIESLCSDNASKISKTYERLQVERAAIEASKPLDMWLRDLDELAAAI